MKEFPQWFNDYWGSTRRKHHELDVAHDETVKEIAYAAAVFAMYAMRARQLESSGVKNITPRQQVNKRYKGRR